MNDNIFKLLVVYLLINVQGHAAAPKILSLAGAIFVIPFLLFSAGAGVLADRFSKRTIIVWTKVMEVLIMTFGIFSSLFAWEIGSYGALFLMATQSAIFGPSKYGIIPELVEPKLISKANGSLTSMTYLAIILGTFLASFITDITNKNFVITASFCLVVAVTGLFTSFGIKYTQPQKSSKKINPLFLYEIYQTLKFSWKIPHLIPCILGSSFFLFIGAFTQLNIIPFAIQSLDLSEVGGGYLFLATAVGIAVGALLSGQLAKGKVELGISCISGFLIALFFLLLFIFSWSLSTTILNLALLGIAGGGYLIPFDAYLQVNSPDEKRGQVIAASNFLSFVGVLFAAFFLYFISEELSFSSASGFAIVGVLTLFANLFITGRLSAFFFPYFVNKILKRFRKLHLLSPVPSPPAAVILQSNSWWDPLSLFSSFSKLKILVPDTPFHRFPWVNGPIDSILIVPHFPERDPKFLAKMEALRQKQYFFCLFLLTPHKNEDTLNAYLKMFQKLRIKTFFAHGVKERIRKRFLFLRYTQKHIKMNLQG